MSIIAALLLTFVLAACNGSGGTEESKAPESPPLDEPPILTVTGPLDQTVATTEVLVTASCSDDRGCTLSVVVDDSFGETLQVADLGNELSREFDLSDFDGQTVTLRVIAVDSAAHARSESRRIHVEGSPELTNERTFPQRVIDFDGQRALLQVSNDLTIVEASGIEENVEVSKFFVIQDAYLTPSGAAYAGLVEDGAFGRAFDWNHSLLVEIGASGSIDVAGDYAVWFDEHASVLVRRQFSTMTNLHLRNAPLSGSGSVANNGVVAFLERSGLEARNQVVTFDGGVYKTLTADADKHNLSPRTDGQGVVYSKTPDNDSYEIAFHDGTAETILAGPRSKFPQPGSDYAIAGGWVAFTELGETGHTNVWTRDPSGTVVQRTAFDVDSLIEALAPDGEVMVVTTENHTLGKDAGIARYLSRPTGELTRVSSELGWSTRIGDTWYVIIARSVFEVRSFAGP